MMPRVPKSHLIEQDPEEPKLHEILAQVYLSQNDVARAEQITSALEAEVDIESRLTVRRYHQAAGVLKYASGEFAAAAEHLERAASVSSRRGAGYFGASVLRARSLHGAGRTDEAIREFKLLLDNYGHGRLQWTTWSVKLHYWLGLAYEDAGQIPAAAGQYRYSAP